LLGICVYNNIAAIANLASIDNTEYKKGGLDDVDNFTGGFEGKPKDVKNILIIDVANMYVGWYMEKYKKELPYTDQSGLISGYIDCMNDHYKKFAEKNNIKTDSVIYIIKNYKYISGKKKMVSPFISKESWDEIYKFVKENTNAFITVAEDYRKLSHSKWKSSDMHYIRARDDYLCFRIAQYYKKKYINTVIMSDDKYKDYEQFGFVPKFLATYIYSKKGKECKDQIVNVEELINPKPNTLGQMRDYKMVKITTQFDFSDPKFLKTSNYKISEPGHVWDII